MKITVILTYHDLWNGPTQTTRVFGRRCDASRFVNKINRQNTPAVVTACYTTAHIKEDDYRAVRSRW